MAFRFLKYSVFLQKHRLPVLIASCGGVFAINMSYHVLPDISFCQLYQTWDYGIPSNLSKTLQDVFQQVLKDYNVSSSKKYSAFASYGFTPVGAGVPWLPAGVRIGLPVNFNSTVDNPRAITKRTVLINGKTVNWDSNTGTALKEALVFSPEAQKFAIAREIARLQSGEPVMSATVAPICLGGAWVCSVVLKQVFGIHAGPVLFRGAVNVLALGLGAVSYVLTLDSLTQWIDYKSDRRAAELSRDYAKGGIEFYDKILSGNKALRLLMGKEGEEMYTPSGNPFPHFLRQKHTPYTSRRERIASMLKEDTV